MEEFVVFLPRRGLYNEGSVRLDHSDVGVPSNADAQTNNHQM